MRKWVKVTVARDKYKLEFLTDVRDGASKEHPVPDMLISEAREKFLQKLDISIKVALSKYTRIQIGTTILGKRQLFPTCMACDRPFGPPGATSSTGGGASTGSPSRGSSTAGGDRRAALKSRDQGPSSHHHVPTTSSEMSNSNWDNDDSTIASLESNSSMSRYSDKSGAYGAQVVPFGVNTGKMDKFVYRAGFKIPKQLANSPLAGGVGGGNEQLMNVQVGAVPRKEKNGVVGKRGSKPKLGGKSGGNAAIGEEGSGDLLDSLGSPSRNNQLDPLEFSSS
jgi:hypothetical protein